ncbi:response regulator [Candidatus Margulisiibacteriota bacterium]
MIEDYAKSYINNLISSFEILFDEKFDYVKEKGVLKIEHTKELVSENDFWINTSFYGSLLGDFFVSMDQNYTTKLLEKIENETKIPVGQKEIILNSSLKELLNTAAGETVQDFIRDFYDITLFSPRIYIGKLNYPKMEYFKCTLQNEKYQNIEAVLAINFRKPFIGQKLEEALTQHAAAVAKAFKAEQALNSVKENITLGIFFLDSDGIIQPGCSSYISKIFFKPIEEIEQLEFVLACPAEIIKDKEVEFTKWINKLKSLREDQSSIYKFLNAAPIDAIVDFNKYDKRYIYQFKFSIPKNLSDRKILVIIEDITDQKLLELKYKQAEDNYRLNLEKKVIEQTKDLQERNDQLGLSNEELQRTKEEADRANQYKSSFLARMTHDLRTPLHVVIGILDMCSRKEEIVANNDLTHSVSLAIRSAERQLSLINTILDLSKIEAGIMDLNIEAFHLNELFFGLKEQMCELLKNQDVHFRLNNKLETEDLVITGDKLRLTQVVYNLLGNAVKYTSEGSITFKCQRAKIDNNDTIYFEIADTGIGMEDNDIEHIFGSYVQLKSTLHQKHHGVGLGLSICKSFIEIHGGQIWAESKINKGSTLKFWIPLNIAKKQTAITQQTTITRKIMDTINYEKLKKKSVLICDDDEFNRSFAQMILEEKINYFLVESGEKTIEILKKNKVDLVLMDLNMPGMDGRTTFKEIRKFDCKIPIIALTAEAMKGTKEALISFGYNGYLSKPFKEKELILFIAETLNLLHK